MLTNELPVLLIAYIPSAADTVCKVAIMSKSFPSTALNTGVAVISALEALNVTTPMMLMCSSNSEEFGKQMIYGVLAENVCVAAKPSVVSSLSQNGFLEVSYSPSAL